jgi:tetratricopeptide (TPR) repeat protein
MGGCVKTQTRNWRCQGLICLTLGLITLAVFAPSLTHDFLAFDDQVYVTENPHVQAGLTWPGVTWAFRSYTASNWHPVTWLSHMLDCQLYGLKPAGHHLTNVLLHTANTLLLFLLLSRMTGAIWRSACVAALFAWHPLHVESVAWIAERKDVLSAFFFMLTLLAYTRYTKGRGPQSTVRSPQSVVHPPSSIFYVLSLLCFALGLMSKPMVVTLPFVLLLLDYWPLGRWQPSTVHSPQSTVRRGGGFHLSSFILHPLLLEKLPFFALSALSCLLTIRAQQGSYSVVSVAGLPLSRRIPHVLVAYVHYLGAMVVPRHLAAHYPYPAATPAAAVAGAGIVLALLSLLAVRLAARRPYLVVGWLWYLGTLAPVIGLVQVGDQAWADRYTYLPLIGLFVALVWGVAELAGRGRDAVERLSQTPNPAGRASLRARIEIKAREDTRPAIWGALAAAVGLALLAGTSLQLRYWKNTRALFEHAAQVTRHNARAVTVLGSLLANEGKLPEAMALYAEALRYDPDNPETHFHLGQALDQQGKPDEAIAEYSRSLWSRQWRERAHILIGVALARQKKYDEAAAHYGAALKLNPESATAENNLARVLHSQGRLDEAIQHYSAALRLDPRLAQAHNNLGVLLLQKGRLAEGVTELQAAVRLRPGDVESQYNLALALNQAEQWNEAAEIFARLAPGRPNDTRLHCEFGLALAHLGKTREAQSHYAHALIAQPDLPEALDRLAWIAATDPRPEFRNGVEAAHLAERACELTRRQQPEMLLTLAAAYGETGRFADAIRTAEEAQALARTRGRQELAARCRSLLEVLKSGQPWRESTAKTPTAAGQANPK